MRLISAEYIITFNEKFEILTNHAIAYDEKILQIDEKDVLLQKYPDAIFEDMGKNFAILPGLINTHIHLEYLANTTSLEYGEFIRWLKSVLKYRDILSQKCTSQAIDDALKALLKCGTTTIGEISSFGLDIEPLKKSKINTIIFNEVLGSDPATVDVMYQDFLQRYQSTLSLADERFIPAISVHAPYSTHPIVAKKVLNLAKDDKKLVATHYMESLAEREWLENGEGNFKDFFASFNPYAKPLTTSLDFLKLFDGIKTLFVHATYANSDELEYINSKENFIISCPVSNRLLENKKLDISKVKNLCIATDGLTSNISLNLWDELRAALFIHESIDIDKLSKLLLSSVTKEAAKALGLNKGVLQKDYDADMIVVEFPDSFDNISSIYKWLILHTSKSKKTIIRGEDV